MRYIFCFLLLFICGCPPKPVVILESEFFPVRVCDANGAPFDRMSILDLIDMESWNEVKITPVKKHTKELTHYLVTPRGIDKLRPKAE